MGYLSFENNQKELKSFAENFKLGIKYLRSVMDLSINNSEEFKIQSDTSVYSHRVNLDLLKSDQSQMLKLLHLQMQNKHLNTDPSFIETKIQISGS